MADHAAMLPDLDTKPLNAINKPVNCFKEPLINFSVRSDLVEP